MNYLVFCLLMKKKSSSKKNQKVVADQWLKFWGILREKGGGLVFARKVMDQITFDVSQIHHFSLEDFCHTFTISQSFFMHLLKLSIDALLILRMFAEMIFTNLNHDFVLLFWLNSKAQGEHVTI